MEISKAEIASAAAVSVNPNLYASSEDLRGAEILVKSLQAEGVKYIWGYPGGAVLHIYDAFYKQNTIQHVLVRHEQAAVHAADGYARATGDVGVALVTSGPGVTNAITGIATAYMDSIPMVVLTGQVPTHAIGQDAKSGRRVDGDGIFIVVPHQPRVCLSTNLVDHFVQAINGYQWLSMAIGASSAIPGDKYFLDDEGASHA